MKHFLLGTSRHVMLGISKQAVFSVLLQTVLSVWKHMSWFCPVQYLLVRVLKYPLPPPLPGMLKQTSCCGAGSHSVLYTVRHSLEGFSLQVLTILSSHSSLDSTLGTLIHCFWGVNVRLWLASVLHRWDAVLPWQLDFETKLQTLSFLGWQPYSKGGHCLVTYLHSLTCDFGQSFVV